MPYFSAEGTWWLRTASAGVAGATSAGVAGVEGARGARVERGSTDGRTDRTRDGADHTAVGDLGRRPGARPPHPHVVRVCPGRARVRRGEESPVHAGADPPVPHARPPPAGDPRRAGRRWRALDPVA